MLDFAASLNRLRQSAALIYQKYHYTTLHLSINDFVLIKSLVTLDDFYLLNVECVYVHVVLLLQFKLLNI